MHTRPTCPFFLVFLTKTNVIVDDQRWQQHLTRNFVFFEYVSNIITCHKLSTKRVYSL